MYSIRATAPSVVSGSSSNRNRKRSNSASSVDHQRHQTAAGEPSGEEGTCSSRSSTPTSGTSSNINSRRPQPSNTSGGAGVREHVGDVGRGTNIPGAVAAAAGGVGVGGGGLTKRQQYPQQMANRIVRDKTSSAMTADTNTITNSESSSSRTTPVRPSQSPAARGGSSRPPSTPTRTNTTASAAPISSGQYQTTPKRKTNTATTRIINSPLIDAPPTPTPDASQAGLIKHEDRWRAMSQLAGSHKQRLDVLDLSNRSLPPDALRYGVPPMAAGAVTDLRYDGNLVGKHDLPSFLDIVAQLFPRLLRISLRNNPCCPTKPNNNNGQLDNTLPNIDPKLKKKLDAAIEATDRERVRMQRLYIIYRLPDLISIDGIDITPTERQLARPLTPVGTRVKKEEWLTKAMAAVHVDVGIGADDAFDSGSSDVAKFGAAEDDNDRDTCSEIVPSETGDTTMSAVEVSMSGLVNYVRTEHKDLVAVSTAPDIASNEATKPVEERQGAGQSMKVAQARINRALPPPSPASKLRTFPAPRQKQRSSSKSKGSTARQLWRQRNKNVASMVDADSDEESTDDDEQTEEDQLSNGGSNYEGDGKEWSGTMGIISSMED